MSKMSYVVIIVSMVTLIELTAINLILPIFRPLEDVVMFADIFNKTAIGFGAIFAGLGGLKIVDDYLKKERIKTKIRKYQKQYPYNAIGKGKNYNYSVIHKKNSGNPLYLHDKKRGTMRHIGNLETYVALGWKGVIPIEEIPAEEFDRINDDRNPILVSGKIGT